MDLRCDKCETYLRSNLIFRIKVSGKTRSPIQLCRLCENCLTELSDYLGIMIPENVENLESIKPQTTLYCEDCFATVGKRYNYCKNCGVKVNEVNHHA